ncbi:hypothetical protein [Priestia megaterium]|uniref:hypothetical protein n=1 Tax=Priestia megaterium TaxID=1404 RepID=UPI00244BC3F0|nr:hypothetical protein [Priestia megaterium]MDH2363875.1 hypothetical protein [Priestia megaterium]
MKKAIIILSTVSIMAIAGFIVFLKADNVVSEKTNANETAHTEKAVKENKDVLFEGKTDAFQNLEQLENESVIIVRGEKINEEKAYVSRSEIDGAVNGGYTNSNFKINKVIKNEENDNKITAGSTIPVFESAFYDEKTDKTYRINGYENMKEAKQYLLFLLPEQDGMYATRAVTYGKVPLDTDDLEVQTDSIGEEDQSQIQTLESIFKEARQKYKD